MNPKLAEQIEKSSDKALDWLLLRLEEDGSYGSAVNDLACYYKSPYLFCIAGKEEEAKRVLNHIKQRFMRKSGDFMTTNGRKSENGALEEYWAYMNGWIALAAQKMGCFDVAYPAFRFLGSFYHADIGGFTTLGPYGESENIVDVLTTAHLGLTSLYFGDIGKAERAGHLLHQFIALQPDFRSAFLLRMSDSGKLITAYPPNAAFFHRVSATEPDQAYFMIGYPVAFLGKLFMATGMTEHLDFACRYLDFAMGCRAIRTFHFSHKVAWAAAIAANLTQRAEYADFSKSIVEYLLSLQDVSGAWLKDQPAHTSFDQTAEIAIWLKEIGSEYRY
jgi:hypothetical protein